MKPRALTVLDGAVVVADLADDEDSYQRRSPAFFVERSRARPYPKPIGDLLAEAELVPPAPSLTAAAEQAVWDWYAEQVLLSAYPHETNPSHVATAALFEGGSLAFAMQGDTPLTITDSGTLLSLMSPADREGIDPIQTDRFPSLAARESALLAGTTRNVAVSFATRRRFGDCAFSTSLIRSIAPRLAVRMVELLASQGSSRINERDMQPAAEAVAAGALRRMTVTEGRPVLVSPGSWVELTNFTGPLGPIDLVMAQDERTRILVELKWSRGSESKPGATLGNCLWDLVKLASCLQERKGQYAYLLAGGPAKSFLGGHPGTHPFACSEWSVTGEELRTRYREWLEFPGIQVRLRAVPAMIKTELVTPPLDALDPETIVVAAARVVCEGSETVPWPARKSAAVGARRPPVAPKAHALEADPILEAMRLLQNPDWPGAHLIRCNESGVPVQLEQRLNRGRGYVGLYLRLPSRSDLVYWLYRCEPASPASRPAANRAELGFCVWTPGSPDAARELIGTEAALLLGPGRDLNGTRRLRIWEELPSAEGREAGQAIACRVRDFLAGL